MEQKLSNIITTKIKATLPNATVNITNFSSEHIGHDAGGAHILVDIKDDSFKDISIIKQHQLVYKILDNELKSGTIHALRIKTNGS